ncbi:ATPase AAA [Babesia ovata]|uniref:ATPase AAA n=1 Tax=Babesia ovata TaxID=189622 RepID=A0A2H6KHB5_9APIC|nr:ATPase AAA [Babesia ovata]GBE62382.1 ATPase AAA [Babesia ovata]
MRQTSDQFYIDVLCLFISPLFSNPEEALRLKLIQWLVRRYLSSRKGDNLGVFITGYRQVAGRYIRLLFSTIEEVCALLDIPPFSIKVDFITDHNSHTQLHDNVYNCIDALRRPKLLDNDEPSKLALQGKDSSALDIHLNEILTPLLLHRDYYSAYSISEVELILLSGANSGKQFIRWFTDFQRASADDGRYGGHEEWELHIIRIEDVLSPFFGESERRLVLQFEAATSNISESSTCICIEGVHHFQQNKEDLSELDRRLLATLLLLLDSVSKSDSILPHTLVNSSGGLRASGSLLVVATSDCHADQLSDALTRPGRLDRVIYV